MPLSKVRNRQRMRLNRLHKVVSPSQTSNPVQPEMPNGREFLIATPFFDKPERDADGNVMPDYDN